MYFWPVRYAMNDKYTHFMPHISKSPAAFLHHDRQTVSKIEAPITTLVSQLSLAHLPTCSFAQVALFIPSLVIFLFVFSSLQRKVESWKHPRNLMRLAQSSMRWTWIWWSRSLCTQPSVRPLCACRSSVSNVPHRPLLSFSNSHFLLFQWCSMAGFRSR